MQEEESIYWDSYLDTVSSLIMKEISSVDVEVKQSIWLQTDDGINLDDDEDQEDPFIDEDQITDYIFRNYILLTASNWTNKRIKKYLDRYYEFD